MMSLRSSFRIRLPAICCLVLFLAFGGGAVRAAVVIGEIMAENAGGLHDQDGDSPDWVEIHNDSPSVVNLAGWHLTDDPTNLTKWSFPATNLPPDSYLVVFASDKNRAITGAELHTNFKLTSTGEYLGLIMPDGVTRAYEYAPAFPPQFANRSYGIGREAAIFNLIKAGAPARFLVPTNGNLGSVWTAMSFDDSSWASVSNAIGFNSLGAGDTNNFGPAALALDFDDDDSGETGPANTVPGFSQATLGANPSVFGGITVALSAIGGGVLDDRDRATPVATATLTQDQLYDDFIFVNGLTNGNGMRIALSGLPPGGDYHLKIWSFDSGSAGDRSSDWVETSSGLTNVIITNYTFNGSTLPINDGDDTFGGYVRSSTNGTLTIEGRRNGGTSHGVFLNALQLVELGYRSLISSDVAAAMTNRNASAYLRIPFAVSNATTISSLRLRMKYDDGFVAWINGQPVASGNAPATPSWNSTATVAHPNASAAAFEEIVLPVGPGLLQNGNNVLAIHGLNLTAADADFLVVAELDSVGITEYPNRYFSRATPGMPNDAGVLGFVANPDFSVQRGFFSVPFTIALTSVTAGAEIRWTTNYSPPSPTNGFVYSGPIPVTNTTLLRAAAFKTNFAASDIVTHSYLFLDSVLRQPNALPNYPTVWQGSYPADYEMDSNVVNSVKYGPTIKSDLRSIPTISITTEHDGLWGPLNGIYNHATSDSVLWERAASVELLNPDGSTGFAVNCGLRTQGNASRDNARTPKHSLRLLFKGDYGPSKLDYDWFPGSSVTQFDNIVMRACFTDSWGTRFSPADATHVFGERYRPEDALYLRDVWVKDSFGAMGNFFGRGTHAQVYLNGLYWGLYNPCERQDASFFSQHLGGPVEAWDVIRDFSEVLDGDKNDWNQMMALCNAGITSEPAYQAVRSVVNVTNLIDYMMLHIFGEAEDWPQHNWYAAHRRATNGLPATPWIFLPWDQEITCDQDYVRNVIDVSNNDTPARIYSQLRAWPEFRREFGDRIQKHLFNGGALTPSNNAARLASRANSISNALVGESARWGDAREFATPGNPATGITFTRDEYWVPELQKLLTNWFPNQQAVALQRFRSGGLFPALGAPAFNQFGGSVPQGFQLVMSHTNGAGTIYFTQDGSDPRTYGTGALNPAARAYAGPITITNSSTVRARVLSGTDWSALVEAPFNVIVDLSMLQLSELFYNPLTSGNVDGDEFEFLELRNRTGVALDLNGFQFTNGITFAFSNVTLAADAFCVLVRNPAAFGTKFPGIAYQGVYTGKLDNSGERLTLISGSGAVVFSLTYGVASPWPATRNTNSIQRVNFSTNYSNPAFWTAALPTPGAPPPSDIFDTDGDGMTDAWEIAHGLNWQLDDASGDPDHDGLSNLGEFQAGTDPQTAQNFFRLGIARPPNSPGSVVLDFYQLPGRAYTIEETASLKPPSWSPVFGYGAGTNSAPIRFTNSISAGGPRFYRLTVNPGF